MDWNVLAAWAAAAAAIGSLAVAVVAFQRSRATEARLEELAREHNDIQASLADINQQHVDIQMARLTLESGNAIKDALVHCIASLREQGQHRKASAVAKQVYVWTEQHDADLGYIPTLKKRILKVAGVKLDDVLLQAGLEINE